MFGRRGIGMWVFSYDFYSTPHTLSWQTNVKANTQKYKTHFYGMKMKNENHKETQKRKKNVG